VVFGLFSIAAGVLLIFLIFVMLAAERRPEMGMARAIGTKRRHLIQQFLFEGYAYDLGAALVGVGLGIVVGLGMVTVMAGLFGRGGFDLQRHVEPRSIVVAFCLGAIVTFLTVGFSAWRVSRLNVVAAIRDLPEDLHISINLGTALRASWREVTSRRAWQRRLAIFALVALAGFAITRGPISGLLLALGLHLGWYATWGFRRLWAGLAARGPALMIVGAPLIVWGLFIKQAFPFTMGVSLELIGLALWVRWVMQSRGAPERLYNRVGYSLAGLALVAFWLLPFDTLKNLGVPVLEAGPEMFFLSGLMLVLGGVWTLMYNSDLLLGALLPALGRLGGLAPVLKLAVTYPLQHRFRTGLTLAMFSLIIFTLMVMSVLNSSFGSTGLNLNRDRGGFDIYGTTSAANPVPDIAASVRSNPSVRDAVVAAGGIGRLGVGLRQPAGQGKGVSDLTWQPYRLNVADDAYLGSTRFMLHSRARGYGSDAQVWRALRTRPGYAVVDATLAGYDGAFVITSFKYADKGFMPARLEALDPRSGTVIPLTVIGVLDNNADSRSTFGAYTGQVTFTSRGLRPPVPDLLFFRTAPGRDVHHTALALGAAFLSNGLDVQEMQAEFDDQRALSNGIITLLQAFMGLGLVVGIAALGVVATRSVVERRQQIGLLRAIGFRRRMVQMTFLMESSFVSLAGTALGVLLGVLLARNLVASFGSSNSSYVQVVVPWGQILLIVLIAYGASLLTTFLPAWQAARVYPAEALRYE
jgi:putative ABC transport system permease protein